MRSIFEDRWLYTVHIPNFVFFRNQLTTKPLQLYVIEFRASTKLPAILLQKMSGFSCEDSHLILREIEAIFVGEMVNKQYVKSRFLIPSIPWVEPVWWDSLSLEAWWSYDVFVDVI